MAATKLAKAEESLHDVVCFLCQQTVEKYVKSLLEELGEAVPKTHNLDDLCNLVALHYDSIRSFRRGMNFLTQFAVETRYPGDSATKRQAKSALRWADRIRTEARTILGVKTRASRRKP